jgi:uncharacterized protein with HEPN domain
MAHSRRKLLADILGACEAIGQFTTGQTRAGYSADRLRRSAVERQFGILGEAVRRLELLDPDLIERITHYRRIVEFRNVLVHGYDSADDDVVWQAVTEKVPVLRREARLLMAELTQTANPKGTAPP